VQLIAHLSDVHFGRIAHAGIVEDLVQEVNDAAVDLVIVSGDLTQRALPRQFEAARAMLDAFTAPVVVVAGNHDVYAWWHQPFFRMVSPLRRYKQYISPKLTQTFSRDGLAVLGINSAFGLTVKGGYISPGVESDIDTYFGTPDVETFKILVVHHHLTRIDALGRHDIAWNAKRTLDTALRNDVDLVLCGHLHISHVECMERHNGHLPLVIASAGTATSDRGRKEHHDANFYNQITVEQEMFSIEERRYVPAERRFIEHRRSQFARVRA